MPTDSQLPFPAELTEAIIDFVDDEQTLRATSLVCKAWVARSRYNLFRVVELCLPAHLDRFNGLLASSPHIAPHIKEIAVSENSLLALLRPAMAIVARLPNSLLKHPQVKPHRLAVHNQSWLPTRYHPEYLTGLSQLSTISSLDLFDVTFTTVADFSIIIRALRCLRSLSATHLDAQRQLPSEELVAIGTELPLLTSLRVISQYPTSVVDWLLQYNTFPVLQDAEVSYEISGIDPNQGLGPFWHATGSTLENLSLTISKRASGASFPIQIQIIGRSCIFSAGHVFTHCCRCQKSYSICRVAQPSVCCGWTADRSANWPRTGHGSSGYFPIFPNTARCALSPSPFNTVHMH